MGLSSLGWEVLQLSPDSCCQLLPALLSLFCLVAQ